MVTASHMRSGVSFMSRHRFRHAPRKPPRDVLQSLPTMVKHHRGGLAVTTTAGECGTAGAVARTARISCEDQRQASWAGSDDRLGAVGTMGVFASGKATAQRLQAAADARRGDGIAISPIDATGGCTSRVHEKPGNFKPWVALLECFLSPPEAAIAVRSTAPSGPQTGRRFLVSMSSTA